MNHRGYKCFDLSSRKIIICRHVIFDEQVFPFAKLHSPTSTGYDFLDDGLPPYLVHHLQSNDGVAPFGPTREAHVPLLPTAHQESPTSPTSVEFPPRGPHQSRGPLPTFSPTTSQIPIPNTLQPTSASSPRAEQTGSGPNTTSPTHPPPIPRPTMITRSQRGIFKPKRQFNLNTTVTKSPIPCNPLDALRDPNWKWP